MGLMVGCTSKKAVNPVDAYVMVIDKLYTADSLSSNIKYLNIDTSLMVNLTDVTKAELLKRLESYGLIVLDMTFDELEKQGFIKNSNFQEGIYFIIEDEAINNNVITMKVHILRALDDASGYNDLVIEYKDSKWEITKGDLWFS